MLVNFSALPITGQFDERAAWFCEKNRSEPH
jgi:hypothetical protein